MKVILLKDHPKLGSKNDIVEVNDGFAQNMLIPKGIAVAATKDALHNLKLSNNKVEKEKQEELETWKQVKKVIESIVFNEVAKRNPKGGMTKTISPKHLIDIIYKKSNIKLTKYQVPKNYVFGFGKNTIPLQLHTGVECNIILEIKEIK